MLGPVAHLLRASTIPSIMHQHQRASDAVRGLLLAEKVWPAQPPCFLGHGQPARLVLTTQRENTSFLNRASQPHPPPGAYQGSPAEARSTATSQSWAPEQTFGSSTLPQQGSSLSTNDIVLIYVLHRLDESGSFLPNILPISAEWPD